MPRDMSETVPAAVLAAFGFARGRAALFPTGLVNRHWLVEADGRKGVVRRYHESRTAAPAVWEQQLIAYAGDRGWPVARALATGTGETMLVHGGRLWSAATFLEGEPGPDDGAGMGRRIGRLLARLHADLAGFQVAGQRPDCGKTWDLDAWVAPADAGGFDDLLAAFGREYPELARDARRYRGSSLAELTRLRYADLPDRPIHGDFQPWNLLFREGELSGLIDFDWCRRDALACDLAQRIPWEDVPFDFVREFFEGYEEVRRLDDAEWALISPLARAALLFFIAFRLAEWRLTGSGRAVQSIERSVTIRLPAMDAVEPKLLALRRR